MDTPDNTQRDDSTKRLEQSFERIDKKIDALTDSLPERYVCRSDYEPWRTQLEGRVKSNEDEMRRFKDWAYQESQAKLQWANDTHDGIKDSIQAMAKTLEDKQNKVLETIQKNNEKLEETAQANRTFKWTRISIIFAAVGTSVTVIISIINYIAIHWHP